MKPTHLPTRVLRLSITSAIAMIAVLSAGAASASDQRGTRVKPGVATRVFVVSGFDANCKPVAAVDVSTSTPPAVGRVSFQRVGPTTVQYSVTGRCIGSRQPGIGVYYTAPPGAHGLDRFEITARFGQNQVATRSIVVAIAED